MLSLVSQPLLVKPQDSQCDLRTPTPQSVVWSNTITSIKAILEGFEKLALPMPPEVMPVRSPIALVHACALHCKTTSSVTRLTGSRRSPRDLSSCILLCFPRCTPPTTTLVSSSARVYGLHAGGCRCRRIRTYIHIYRQPAEASPWPNSYRPPRILSSLLRWRHCTRRSSAIRRIERCPHRVGLGLAPYALCIHRITPPPSTTQTPRL